MFDENHTVYRLDGVSAIPLEENRATVAVNMLATLKGSKVPLPAVAIIQDDDVPVGEDISLNETPEKSEPSASPHVTFLKVKKGSSEDADLWPPSSANSSGVSTPTRSFSPSPIAKVLADQLSFWTKLSKRTLQPAVASPGLRSPSTESLDSFDGRMANGEGPKEVLKSIMAKTTLAPATPQEQHTELDDKIVKETIKEFIKGGMYFSYNFGMHAFGFVFPYVQ